MRRRCSPAGVPVVYDTYDHAVGQSVWVGGRKRVVVDGRGQHKPSLVVSSLRSHLFVLSLLGGLVTLL